MRDIKFVNNFMIFVVVLSELKTCEPQSGQFSALGAGLQGSHNGTAKYLGPFQGRHLSAAYIS